ncbi:hypothetical protein K439DRAFT_460712 [Ramaria rubella]|nr:hypothetical protein K439DRAFT_460712 [Ramaria rubella]
MRCIIISQFENPLLPHILSSMCPHPSSTISTLIQIWLLGICISISAAEFCMWCYKTMGRFFTFEVVIMREHKLVNTSPYAIVRHPGYTDAVLLLRGAAMTCLASGSYTIECQLLTTPLR